VFGAVGFPVESGQGGKIEGQISRDEGSAQVAIRIVHQSDVGLDGERLSKTSKAEQRELVLPASAAKADRQMQRIPGNPAFNNLRRISPDGLAFARRRDENQVIRRLNGRRQATSPHREDHYRDDVRPPGRAVTFHDSGYSGSTISLKNDD
jgi:hypothetical protein